MFHDQQVTQINYLPGKEGLSFICLKVVTFSFQGLASKIPRKDKEDRFQEEGGKEREEKRRERQAKREREQGRRDEGPGYIRVHAMLKA
jgi:hypothetical protein